VRPVNIYGDALTDWSVVEGVDTILYDVAPVAPVHDRVIFVPSPAVPDPPVPVTAAAEAPVGKVDNVVSVFVRVRSLVPLALTAVIVNVY
jgi:hypothetical protein